MRFERKVLEPEFQPVALTVVIETIEELRGLVNDGRYAAGAIVEGLRIQGQFALNGSEGFKPVPKKSSSSVRQDGPA